MPRIYRLYNVQDSVLIVAAGLMEYVLPDDIELFTAFDSTVTSDYPSRLNHAISLVNSKSKDDTVVQKQAQYTAAYKAAHDDCYMAFKTVAFFVRKAFPDDEAMQKKFGLPEISKVLYNQNKFSQFFDNLCSASEEHKAVLIDAGCNQNVFTALPLQSQTLKDTLKAQKKFKKLRATITQERIKLLNALYKLMKLIEDIAENIFANDSVRRAKYKLPQRKKRKSRKNKSDEEEPQKTEE